MMSNSRPYWRMNWPMSVAAIIGCAASNSWCSVCTGGIRWPGGRGRGYKRRKRNAATPGWSKRCRPVRMPRRLSPRSIFWRTISRRVPALASGLGRLDGLKRRLTLILTGTAPKRLNMAGRLAVLVLGLALLPLLPTLARSQKKPDQPAPNSETTKVEDTDPQNEALAFRPTPLNLTGGDNEVAALAVSRDGRYLAAGTGYVNRPGEVRVWTVKDHKQVLVYATAQGVATVAFSRDGKYLASCGYDGLAVVREFPSGKVVCVLPLDDAARLAFAPDGQTLVTATEARTIKVWKTATGAEIKRLENDAFRCYCIAYSPDGKWLAVGGGDLGQGNVPDTVLRPLHQVTIWDTKTWKPAGKLIGHQGRSCRSLFRRTRS